jgi:hypothetical protein
VIKDSIHDDEEIPDSAAATTAFGSGSTADEFSSVSNFGRFDSSSSPFVVELSFSDAVRFRDGAASSVPFDVNVDLNWTMIAVILSQPVPSPIVFGARQVSNI